MEDGKAICGTEQCAGRAVIQEDGSCHACEDYEKPFPFVFKESTHYECKNECGERQYVTIAGECIDCPPYSRG